MKVTVIIPASQAVHGRHLQRTIEIEDTAIGALNAIAKIEDFLDYKVEAQDIREAIIKASATGHATLTAR